MTMTNVVEIRTQRGASLGLLLSDGLLTRRVVITAVDDDSRASCVLAEGDTILAINGERDDQFLSLI